MYFELSWKLGGNVGFLINLFGFFELTMVVVRRREMFFQPSPSRPGQLQNVKRQIGPIQHL